MRTVNLTKKLVDPKSFRGQPASSFHFNQLITDDTLIYVEGELPILYLNLDIDTSDLLRACLNLNYSKNVRNGGLKVNTAYVGSTVANHRKDGHCNYSSVRSNFPDLHDVFLKYAKLTAEYYHKHFPDLFDVHLNRLKEKGKEVLDEYIMQPTPYTSGVVNKNAPLNYHYDRGNTPMTLSATLTLKRSMTGGYLSLPGYDLGIQMSNNSLLLFNGQRILHGVTPMNLKKHGYRFTNVFYTLEKMWKCLPIEEELREAQKRLESKQVNES